jgi:hypothetical protein
MSDFFFFNWLDEFPPLSVSVCERNVHGFVLRVGEVERRK